MAGRSRGRSREYSSLASRRWGEPVEHLDPFVSPFRGDLDGDLADVADLNHPLYRVIDAVHGGASEAAARFCSQARWRHVEEHHSSAGRDRHLGTAPPTRDCLSRDPRRASPRL